ncbi:osmotically inducible protein OsmC [Litoreibacter halocynthiae]|uniref:Osmotically inducible protein OsmC n=1 Tax=Litoreibacter halocynthiae TaxID=1242689 RepID=A0A4R7LJW1_9RHOB|nr:OsmC family protein [Litoreibacter halocynthiae]TDT74922.1 osmotically inducible protein OsmC [Litoreibacter halocynthiae]
MSVNTGSAKWSGTLKEGKGHVSTKSGALKDQPYGYNTRFEDAPGTNPEELIGAAHASCFSMALSMVLGEHDLTADSIETSADITLEQKAGGFTVTKSHLTVKASIPDATEEAFMEAATGAKENCPISKLLDCDITMDANLVS